MRSDGRVDGQCEQGSAERAPLFDTNLNASRAELHVVEENKCNQILIKCMYERLKRTRDAKCQNNCPHPSVCLRWECLGEIYKYPCWRVTVQLRGGACRPFKFINVVNHIPVFHKAAPISNYHSRPSQ